MPSIYTGPNPASLPGDSVSSSIVNGIAFYAELVFLLGIFGFAIIWIVGAASGNKTGRRIGMWGFLASIVMALLIGIVSFFTNYYFDL